MLARKNEENQRRSMCARLTRYINKKGHLLASDRSHPFQPYLNNTTGKSGLLPGSKVFSQSAGRLAGPLNIRFASCRLRRRPTGGNVVKSRRGNETLARAGSVARLIANQSIPNGWLSCSGLPEIIAFSFQKVLDRGPRLTFPPAACWITMSIIAASMPWMS